jgi:hypothetical protein
MQYIKFDPLLHAVRGDARYQKLVTKMKLTE